MKKLANVSVGKFSTVYGSYYYTQQYDDFNISCTILKRKLGTFTDTYLLGLEGSSANIQMFLEYLKFNKFKIH